MEILREPQVARRHLHLHHPQARGVLPDHRHGHRAPGRQGGDDPAHRGTHRREAGQPHGRPRDEGALPEGRAQARRGLLLGVGPPRPRPQRPVDRRSSRGWTSTCARARSSASRDSWVPAAPSWSPPCSANTARSPRAAMHLDGREIRIRQRPRRDAPTASAWCPRTASGRAWCSIQTILQNISLPNLRRFSRLHAHRQGRRAGRGPHASPAASRSRRPPSTRRWSRCRAATSRRSSSRSGSCRSRGSSSSTTRHAASTSAPSTRSTSS